MSLYRLGPKPGRERYTIEVGWTPHLSFNVIDFDWDPMTDPDNEPDAVVLGRVETILDPTDVLAAVDDYAHIPDGLPGRLRAGQAAHPPRQGLSPGPVTSPPAGGAEETRFGEGQ